METVGERDERVDVHEGHRAGFVVRVRFGPGEAAEFAQTCDRVGLSPTELLRVAYREYAARHSAARKSA